MIDERTLKCLSESDADTIEISLRKRMETLISEGNIETAEEVEDVIERLNSVQVCLDSVQRISYKR